VVVAIIRAVLFTLLRQFGRYVLHLITRGCQYGVNDILNVSENSIRD